VATIGEATIRPARGEDLDEIRQIELRAGRLFAEIGMQDIADHPPPAVEELRRYVDAGRAFAADVDGRLAGFALVDLVDGHAHLEQLSIDPAFARRRIGQRLIDEVDRWAADQQHQEVTLTTFRDVPWNAPYYARLGFRAVDGAELTPALVELLAVEASHGLDPAQRVVMRRAVTREPFA